LPLRRPGAALEPAEFAGLAGRRLRPDATLVVRDPSGLGPLGLSGRRNDRPSVVSFVRGLELHAFDRERSGHASAGFADRLDAWRDRRAVRRLERAALDEATALFSDDPELAKALASEYGIDARLLRPTVPPLPRLPPGPPRAKARATLGIPPDVSVVVAPSASESAEAAGVDRVREAFRRIRSLFPGVRLVVVGCPTAVEPGVVGVPARDTATLALALAAADVAVVAPPRPGFDPGVVFALRAGIATIVGVGVRLPIPPESAIRTAVSDDPGDLASALAELVADPAAARNLAGRGPGYAAAYLPERVADQIDVATATGAR
jgi:glycosyltransferase involved in cell wall biosynthesis